ncbi:BH3-only protein sayonara isoform 2-T2 [Cochliomyia hominivorax]
MMGCNSSMDTNSVLDEPTGNMDAMALPTNQWPLSQANPTDVVLEFVRLDEKISKLETTCPGPRLATCEAWIEHLQSKLNELMGVDAQHIKESLRTRELVHNSLTTNSTLSALSQQQQEPSLPSQVIDHGVLQINGYTAEQPFPYNNNKAVAYGGMGHYSSQGKNLLQNGVLPFNSNSMSANYKNHNHRMNGFSGGGGSEIGVGGHGLTRLLPTNDMVTKTPTQDLVNLALNLGVIGDVQKASTHEDFFAQLSESALHLMTIRCFNEILEHTKIRLKTLLDSYAELNELYVNHDGFIAFISGGTYMSRLEESIDSQLEVARDVRDKLGSTLEQWRICGLLLRASANSATQGLRQWRRVKTIVNPKEKLETALSCRKDLQASLVSMECAQLSLPNVEIKFISNRQILAVKHCNTYMVTDISNLARYDHTSKVFSTYESNTSKASAWLYETFNKTLRQDFDRAEETVRNLAKTLRDHREEIFTAARR